MYSNRTEPADARLKRKRGTSNFEETSNSGERTLDEGPQVLSNPSRQKSSAKANLGYEAVYEEGSTKAQTVKEVLGQTESFPPKFLLSQEPGSGSLRECYW